MITKKKMLITAAVLIGFFVLAYFLIKPFHETGLEITVKPTSATILIKGVGIYSGDQVIDLEPGEYYLTVYSNGYKRKEMTLGIKQYGKTEAVIELKDKTRPLLKNLPYYGADNNGYIAFIINGKYNDFLEPNYIVNYFSEDGLELAKEWLKKNEITEKNHYIEYIEDGG